MGYPSSTVDLTEAEVPSLVVADAFEWQTKVANRYTARFISERILDNAGYGDLLDVGWTSVGTLTAPVASTTPSNGDLDDAADPGIFFLLLDANNDGWASPNVIGGVAMLNAQEREFGTRPTKIECVINGRFTTTTDGADVTGFGISPRATGLWSINGAGSVVVLMPGATNFEIWNGAAAADTGVVKDTSLHELVVEIAVAAATYRVLLDGTEVVAATAVTQDFWPKCLRGYQDSVGGNIELFGYDVNYRTD